MSDTIAVDQAHAIAGYVWLAIMVVVACWIFYQLWFKGPDGPFS